MKNSSQILAKCNQNIEGIKSSIEYVNLNSTFESLRKSIPVISGIDHTKTIEKFKESLVTIYKAQIQENERMIKFIKS